MTVRTPSGRMLLLAICGLALAYALLARLGMVLWLTKGGTPLVWPAAGLSLAALVIAGPRLWPGILAGTFAACVLDGQPLFFSAVVAVGNTLAALTGWALLRRAGFERRFARVVDVILFFVLGGLVSPLVSAVIGTAGLALDASVTWGNAGPVALGLWLGDAMGILTLAPLVLVWIDPPSRRVSVMNLVEAGVLFLLMVMVSQLVYGGYIAGAADRPLSYATFPFVIWAALRFGQRGTTVIVVTGLAVAIWGTIHGHGPFVHESAQRSIVLLHAFMAAVTMAGLVLGAAIEERRSAEEELRRSRSTLELEVVHRTRQLQEELEQRRTVQEMLNRYEFIVNTSSELMTLISSDFRYEAVNDWFCIALNKQREDIIGRSVPEIWGQEAFEQGIKGHLTRALSGEEVRYQSWFPFPGTGDRCVDVSYTPYKNTEGTVTHVVAVSWDVTEREQAGEQLRKLSRAVEQSPVSIVITDLQGSIEYVNPRFELVTGYSRAEALGNNPRILKSGERSTEDYLHLWTTIASGGEWHGEFHNKKKNGELFWEYASISPVRNAEGVVTHYVAVKEDITERKRLERELEQLVYVTSHDLRSPLVNIQGFSKELERSFTEIHSAVSAGAGALTARLRDVLDHDVPEAFRYIYASTRKMDALIDGLLRLSRLGRGSLTIRPVDMQSLIQGVLQTFEYTVQQQKVTVQVGSLPPCRGDEIQINQLFSNLVDNALKYLDPARPGRLEVEGKVNGTMAVYEVRDNGVGIAPEHCEQIFELFHRLQPTMVEGEGLGLTVARKIVDRHGGTIAVSSAPGEGTTFIVSLPK